MKEAREKKQITYKENPIKLSADFSAETLQTRREWHNTLNVVKGKASNQDDFTQQGSRSDLKENQKLYRQAKAKRIQHH